VNFLDQVLFFSDSSRDVAMANNSVSYLTSSLAAEVSQDPIFASMVDIELQMISPTFYFRYLKRCFHGNQFSGKNGAKLSTPALIALSIQNRMGYRYLNVRVNSANDASISCKNFVNCGPVNPDKTGII